MRLTRILLAICASMLLSAGMAAAQTPGQALPPWSPGVLDIHHLNTGKGDSAFFILPDGTTLLVDAGDTHRPGPRVTDPRPDGSRPPGEWIARYILRMLEGRPVRQLDYALLTHFHGDHMGEVSAQSKDSPSGPYKLAGITDTGERVVIRTMVDRGWPSYDYPSPLGGQMMENYRSFLKWQSERNGMRVERFQPGRNDQIALRHGAAKYPTFEIRNIAANGEIWTGTATNTRQHFPPLEDTPKQLWPSENMCSIAFRLSYGRFNYFIGGDMPGLPSEGSPPWHDVETPVAQAVGPVDVHVLNHHGFHDSANAFFLSALRPRVHILSVYSPTHPDIRVLSRLSSTRLYPGPRDIFATNIMDVTRVVIGESLNRLKSDQGHILVRVAPGGETYHVVILEDSAETYRVKAVHGPYASR